jgi:hypothetical protein
LTLFLSYHLSAVRVLAPRLIGLPQQENNVRSIRKIHDPFLRIFFFSVGLSICRSHRSDFIEIESNVESASPAFFLSEINRQPSRSPGFKLKTKGLDVAPVPSNLAVTWSGSIVAFSRNTKATSGSLQAVNIKIVNIKNKRGMRRMVTSTEFSKARSFLPHIFIFGSVLI